MSDLHVVKIGGNVLSDAQVLSGVLSGLSSLEDPFILIHGGGEQVDLWLRRLGESSKKIDGRRITDALTLDLAVMQYAGLLNKNLVSNLQSLGVNSLGMCGADLGCIVSKKREHKEIDYGFVGDIVYVNSKAFELLLEAGITPICCAITSDNKGQLLNTNADTVAAEIAISLSVKYSVKLWYCFDKKGVLLDLNDEKSTINHLVHDQYIRLLQNGKIKDGMKPKLENCFQAIQNGVENIFLTDHLGISNLPEHSGTKITWA